MRDEDWKALAKALQGPEGALAAFKRAYEQEKIHTFAVTAGRIAAALESSPNVLLKESRRGPPPRIGRAISQELQYHQAARAQTTLWDERIKGPLSFPTMAFKSTRPENLYIPGVSIDNQLFLEDTSLEWSIHFGNYEGQDWFFNYTQWNDVLDAGESRKLSSRNGTPYDPEYYPFHITSFDILTCIAPMHGWYRVEMQSIPNPSRYKDVAVEQHADPYTGKMGGLWHFITVEGTKTKLVNGEAIDPWRVGMRFVPKDALANPLMSRPIVWIEVPVPDLIEHDLQDPNHIWYKTRRVTP